jgi:hypothetical protein
MPEYRAYVVGLDGHFTDFEGMVCEDDAKAIEKARRLVDGHDVEAARASSSGSSTHRTNFAPWTAS